MKIYFSIISITILFVLSCNDSVDEKVIIDSNSFLVDSFKIKQLAASIEIKNLKSINAKFISLTPETNSIRVYKQSKDKEYVLEKSIFLATTNIPHSFFRDKQYWHVVDSDGNLFKYDSLWNFLNKKPINFNLKTLKTNNIIAVYNNLPIKIYGDTMITHVFHKDYSGMRDYFKEQPYVKFKVEKDSVVLIQQCGQKPQNAIEYYLSMPFHCYRNNEIYTIYPCFDTIYKYNVVTDKSSKIAIENPEYKVPKKFPVDSSMNFPFIAKYLDANFSYAESIVYNPITDHFVIFYYTFPQKKGGSVNTEEKKSLLNAIVLDKNLKKIHTLIFNKEYYSPESSFYIKGQGVALGVYKNSFDFETTVFHIFNF